MHTRTGTQSRAAWKYSREGDFVLVQRSVAWRGCLQSWLALVYFVAIFPSTPSSLPSGMIPRASFLRQEVRNVFTMSDLRRRWVSRDSSCAVREEHSKAVRKEYRWDGSARRHLGALWFFFSCTHVKGGSVSGSQQKVMGKRQAQANVVGERGCVLWGLPSIYFLKSEGCRALCFWRKEKFEMCNYCGSVSPGAKSKINW